MSAAPELNQLVRVRGRHWVVGDVRASSLEPAALTSNGGAHHLVDLTSVEDDGRGDELAVIWEVEPDARILDKETLPRPERGRFDDPERLAAFLDAVRWGAVTSADSRALQAPFRSGIVLEDYQLDPVVRALAMPRVNLLIADDVGLGKTIEAGLVMQEMLLRHRARSVIVVCPASLSLKWQREMAEKFGLEFRIVDAELLRRLRRDRGLAANPWRHFPRLIVSIDWLKRPRAMSLFREVLPVDARAYPRTFDLLVIDEVHTVAPSGRGRYAVDSQRTQAIRELAPHFEHHLYLSATPHNGYQESFTALLELLDPQRFARGVIPKPEAVHQVMVRRLKAELREDPALRRADGSPRFAERKIVTLEVRYPDHEREVHRLLDEYAVSRRASTGEHKAARQAAEFVSLLLKKRLFSSPAAFATTLAVHRQTLAAVAPEASGRALQAAVARLDEDVDDDTVLTEATEEALAEAGAALGAATPAHEKLLDAMQRWADAWKDRTDAKATQLLAFLDETCRIPGAGGSRRWNDERVLVFTEYRDTQRYLYERLAQHLPEGDVTTRVEMLYGGMDTDRRERIKAEFQAHPARCPVRILLATDAASEGIDLQLHCHRLVHVETPFSPARMEQRNGRIDRHGQPAPVVLINYFVGAGWEDAAPGSMEDDLGFLVRLARKLEQVRADLGNVGPLLAEQVERRMLGDHRATIEVAADPKRTANTRVLRIERSMREEVQRLAQTLRDSRDALGLTPEAVERMVRVGLAEARQPPLVPTTFRREQRQLGPLSGPAEGSGAVSDVGDGYVTSPAFAVGQLTGSFARTIMDLADPLSEEIRPITFDHAAAENGNEVVLCHLEHPLVAACSRLLRAAIWDTGQSRSGLSRVTARLVPDRALGQLVIVVHGRLIITGQGGHRLHEEVIYAGGRLAGGRFSREGFGLEVLRRALDAASSELPPPHVLDALVAAWPVVEGPLRDALNSRAEDRGESLEQRLREQVAKEVRDIEAVLQELRRSILDELDDGDAAGEQLTLGFDLEERQQHARDVDALRARVDAIPREIEAEQAEIRRRYAERTPRVFPAAVTFLVPRRLCTDGLEAVIGATAQRNPSTRR